ncbi:hypothetical protein Mapa_002553 [Marchantia paleacea]|nr:hypothetical protein Mapa_002553 [Marchantia paleacea]
MSSPWTKVVSTQPFLLQYLCWHLIMQLSYGAYEVSGSGGFLRVQLTFFLRIRSLEYKRAYTET